MAIVPNVIPSIQEWWRQYVRDRDGLTSNVRRQNGWEKTADVNRHVEPRKERNLLSFLHHTTIDDALHFYRSTLFFRRQLLRENKWKQESLTDTIRCLDTTAKCIARWMQIGLIHAKKKLRATCSSVNWSPPKAATHGLIPPVPNATNVRPINASHLTTFTCIELLCYLLHFAVLNVLVPSIDLAVSFYDFTTGK